ncbi:MAG: M48 family metallopeptidase [Acidimicrobiia bacterium]
MTTPSLFDLLDETPKCHGAPETDAATDVARVHDPDACTSAQSPLESVESVESVEVELTSTVEPLPVRVIRSAKRRRTIQARMVNGVLEVLIPGRATAADEAHYVETMRSKFARSHRAGAIDLEARAADLARRFSLPTPSSIGWVSNMDHRWGSCTIVDRTIRISDRLVSVPTWVLDAVIMHELAHLVVPNHSDAFWALANRYPKMERARGYLICASGQSDD